MPVDAVGAAVDGDAVGQGEQPVGLGRDGVPALPLAGVHRLPGPAQRPAGARAPQGAQQRKLLALGFEHLAADLHQPVEAAAAGLDPAFEHFVHRSCRDRRHVGS